MRDYTMERIKSGRGLPPIGSDAIDVDTIAKNGVWLRQPDGTHFCSECGRDASYERFDSTCFRELLSANCPYCGTGMKIDKTKV